MIEEDRMVINFNNILMMRLISVFFSVIPALSQAALPPDTFSFTINATVVEAACRWEHTGATTANLGNLTVGTAVNNDTPIGRLTGVCDGVRTTQFGFTVSLTQTPKNGLIHKLWDTTKNQEIVNGYMEISQNDITELAIRTEGIPLQVGDYSNNVVMNIAYD